MKTTEPRGPGKEVMGGLAKGLTVLKVFTREAPSLTLAEIATKADLPAATARRCLHTLEELGYVTRSGRNFLLRPKVLDLGAAYLDSMNIEALTKTHLEDLASQTGDSASMAVLDGREIVYVARASLRTLVRLEAHVGSRFPAYPTSMGRVLLADQSREWLKQYFAVTDIVALTDRTVTDRRKLMTLIEDCRRDGYSAVEDELAYGIVAVAVPVYDQMGKVVASINCSSHPRKIEKRSLIRERVPILKQVSEKISSELKRVPALSLSVRA